MQRFNVTFTIFSGYDSVTWSNLDPRDLVIGLHNQGFQLPLESILDIMDRVGIPLLGVYL